MWACFSRRAWSAAISASGAPTRSVVSSLTCSKHSAQASRPQRRHIQLLEKMDVMHVSVKKVMDAVAKKLSEITYRMLHELRSPAVAV